MKPSQSHQIIRKQKTVGLTTLIRLLKIHVLIYKHLKKSNAACFYMPIVLKLLIVVQMWKHHEEGN